MYILRFAICLFALQCAYYNCHYLPITVNITNLDNVVFIFSLYERITYLFTYFFLLVFIYIFLIYNYYLLFSLYTWTSRRPCLKFTMVNYCYCIVYIVLYKHMLHPSPITPIPKCHINKQIHCRSFSLYLMRNIITVSAMIRYIDVRYAFNSLEFCVRIYYYILIYNCCHH